MLQRGKLDGAPGIFVVIASFKLTSGWESLEEQAQLSAADEARQLLANGKWEAESNVYISRGLKAHCDFFLRVRARELQEAQRVVQGLRSTALGRSCEVRDILVGVTKPRQYINDERSPALARELNAAHYTGAGPEYAIVIPVKKSAHWWNVPEPERRREIEQHTRASLPYLDRVKRELYHSTGLDDFDFITYFETADLRAFHELSTGLMAIPENEYHARWGDPVLLGSIQPVGDPFSRLSLQEHFGSLMMDKETRNL